MTDKEKIRAEIERQYVILKGEYSKTKGAYVAGRMDALDYVEQFINSLPEETTPKGYDESYLNECIAKASKTWKGVDVDKFMDDVRGRESGGLEEAVDAEIVKDIHNLLHVKSRPLPMPSEYKFGEKVKIIILKDDE